MLNFQANAKKSSSEALEKMAANEDGTSCPIREGRRHFALTVHPNKPVSLANKH